MATTRTPAIQFVPQLAAALACLAPATAAQWRKVDAPEVALVSAVSEAPSGVPIYASLQLPPTPLYISGGAQAVSLDDGLTWMPGHSVQTPLLEDVAHHPLTPQTLVGGSASHAAWVSHDSGASWNQSYSGSNLIQRVAVDPMNPDLAYGVGWNIVPGASFHRSYDGGKSWQSTDPLFFDTHSDVIAIPSVGNSVVLLASGTGINRSRDNGDTFANVYDEGPGALLSASTENPSSVWAMVLDDDYKTHLLRSEDAGTTWLPVGLLWGDLIDLLAHPTDPQSAWAVSKKRGIFYTTNSGADWTEASGIAESAGITSLARRPDPPHTFLAGGEGGLGGIWRSTDGQTWEQSNTGMATAVPGFHFDSAGRVYGLGLGLPTRRQVAQPGWEALDYQAGSNASISSFASAPDAPHELVFVRKTDDWSTFDLLYASPDDGVTWYKRSPFGSLDSSTEIREVAFDADGVLWAGAQYGTLYSSVTLGETWSKRSVPWKVLRGFVPDPFLLTRMHAIDDFHYFRSEDRGTTWEEIDIGPNAQRYPYDLRVSAAREGLLFLIAGNAKDALYRSVDFGDTWQRVGVGLPAAITRLAIDPHHASLVLVGTEGHGVYRSLDGGSHFSPWNWGSDPNGVVVGIEFDPAEGGRAWMSLADGSLLVRAVSQQ